MSQLSGPLVQFFKKSLLNARPVPGPQVAHSKYLSHEKEWMRFCNPLLITNLKNFLKKWMRSSASPRVWKIAPRKSNWFTMTKGSSLPTCLRIFLCYQWSTRTNKSRWEKAWVLLGWVPKVLGKEKFSWRGQALVAQKGKGGGVRGEEQKNFVKEKS